jgi:hypothetical protein
MAGASPVIERGALPAPSLRTDVTIALLGVLLFASVSALSGKVATGDGLGWDGRAYAAMVTNDLGAGSGNTQTRPLLPLVTRIPYALGLDIIESFQLMNHLYAFILYFFAARLLARYGADARVRAVVVANLALCIATSKMFGFYPVLIDLGALAVVTAAFYFVTSGRRWMGPLACVLAVASREFGVAVVLYGIHRALRRRRFVDAVALLPAIVAMAAIRWVAAAGAAQDAAPLSVTDAVDNLKLWTSPAFVIVFAYFSITVFGGISALLATRPHWALRRLLDEPERATFLIVVLGATAAGDLDIWRYLAFTLPVALVLIAHYYAGADVAAIRRAALVMTVVTLMTQQPFRTMNEDLYFRDWFPLYFERMTQPPDLMAVWSARLATLALMMAAVAVGFRRPLRATS